MNEFIAKIKDGAILAQKQCGILASLTIAQAILESGWGKSSIGNNIFGIKAGAGWTGKTQVRNTTEYENGKYINVTAVFRDYDSISDSIIDHAKLFTSLSRYSNLVGCTDYKQACKNVAMDGYATDPDYSKKLIAIIEQNSLNQFDVSRETPVTNSYETYNVSRETTGYLTAANAATKISPRAIVKPGTYFVFNKSLGMINVTKQKGIPGNWINPKETNTKRTYTVKTGDSLSKISNATGVPLSKIIGLNPQIKNPRLIYSGEVINLE